MRLFWLVWCALVTTAFAQSDANIHVKTTLPPAARFEIAQSTLAAKWTFRLDRNTGQVYQLVKTIDGDLTWQAMTVEGLHSALTSVLGSDQPKSDKPRFVIFSSGISARFTFLMDTDTGQTWQLQSMNDIDGWWKLEH